MFHVGQRVVCVDASPGTVDHPLVRGGIYTIAGFDLESHPDVAGILIEEWKHPKGVWHDGPWGFRPERFRPLVEKKTSIEIFEKMLKPEKVDA